MGIIDKLIPRSISDWNFNRLQNKVISEKIQHLHAGILDIAKTTPENERKTIAPKIGKLLKHKTNSYVKLTDTFLRKNYKIKDLSRLRSPYNYTEIDNYKNKESYLGRSIERQIEAMFRNGFDFVSSDQRALRIIKTNIKKMEILSDSTFETTLSTAAKYLALYGIAFIEKVRTLTKVGKFKDLNDNLAIAALEAHKPHNKIVKINKYNKLVELNLEADTQLTYFRENRVKELPAKDIIVLRTTDPGYMFFPRPQVLHSLDDILSLRSLEETVELLTTQFSSPLLHIKKGSNEFPANPNDVNTLTSEINNMATNGFIVTDHLVEIEAVNLQTSIADLMSYIEHFKNRVLGGTGSSPISVGETASSNRNTAESIDNSMGDHCMNTLRVIQDTINTDLIPDILLENGYTLDQLFDEGGELIVTIQFKEVQVEKQLQSDNHYLQLFQGNGITFDELRRALRKPSLKPADMKNLFYYLFPNGKEDTEGKQKNTPTNQHGTKSGPGSRKD